MYRRVMHRVLMGKALRLAVVVVLAAMVVILVSLLQTPTYEASAEVLVKQNDRQTNLAGSKEFPTAHLETPALMAYAIDSRPVAEEAIGRLGLEMSPAELLDNLTVEQVENTQSIVLTYEDTNPAKATKIVNTVGEVSSELISQRSAAGSNVRANVYEEAVVPDSPVRPDLLRNGLLTLVIGLVLCAVYLVRMGQRGSCLTFPIHPGFARVEEFCELRMDRDVSFGL
jgi:capsular polysaccharide biosynthesis protein